MRVRGPLLGLPLLVLAGSASAGHGLLNSFAGIEWLPPPGRTPDQVGYRLELWQEAIEIALAPSAVDAISRHLTHARERLAEAEAMVRAGKRDAAARALTTYPESLGAAVASLDALHGAERDAQRLRVATALLEQQYIVATDYLDLPRDVRTVLGAAISAAAHAYDTVGSQLDRRTKDSLLFKEEEVRWSWQMALAADEQGL